MIYCFYLFDRDGVCLYYEDWNRAKKPKSLPGGGPPARPAHAARTPQVVPATTMSHALTQRAARARVTEEQKLIFGLLFSLKATVCAMRPGGDGKMTVDGLQVHALGFLLPSPCACVTLFPPQPSSCR
jgi:hypothetical protein